MGITSLYRGDGTGAVFILPGMQSHPKGQVAGLRPILQKHYRSVLGYDYSSGKFDPRVIANTLSRSVSKQRAITGAVTLIGFSIGAPLSVLGVSALLDSTIGSTSNLNVIMVDPPFGASSMKSIPPWLAPLSHPLFRAAALVTPSLTMGSRPASEEAMMQPSRADREAIFADACDASSYYNAARANDLQNQQGHSLRTWFQQLAWLTGDASNVPFQALRGIRCDLITARSDRNTVLHSEQSAAQWQERVAFATVRNVDAEHCATLRAQPLYAEAFRQLLES